MRSPILAALICLSASAAFADDTKPPAITAVKPTVKGSKVTIEAIITDETGVLSATVHHRGRDGKVEDTPLTKAQYEDRFTATFQGGADTEYWIDATDLLGNGPSTYGTASHPMALGGAASKGTAVATKDEPKQEQSGEERHTRRHHGRQAAKLEIEHHAPAGQQPEGRDLTLRAKMKNAVVAVIMARPKGTPSFTNLAMTHEGGESWQGVVPASLAKGTVEYLLVAKNGAGDQVHQGEGGSQTTPYTITFKSSAPVAAAEPQKAAGPYEFSHYPLYRVEPNRPILVRAQIAPSKDDGDMPDKVEVLFRGNDAQDLAIEMIRDETGGYGGYKAELPAQGEGAIFYEIVACDAKEAQCGVDTGSKHRWHAAAVASQPGSAMPLPLDAVSAKAPASLPE